MPNYYAGIAVGLGSDSGWTAPNNGMIIAVTTSSGYGFGVFLDQAKKARLFGQNNPSGGYATSSFIVQRGIRYYFDITNTTPVFYPFL